MPPSLDTLDIDELPPVLLARRRRDDVHQDARRGLWQEHAVLQLLRPLAAALVEGQNLLRYHD